MRCAKYGFVKNVKNVVAVSELSVSRDEDMEMVMFF
jgi:hypothetical protein